MKGEWTYLLPEEEGEDPADRPGPSHRVPNSSTPSSQNVYFIGLILSILEIQGSTPSKKKGKSGASGEMQELVIAVLKEATAPLPPLGPPSPVAAFVDLLGAMIRKMPEDRQNAKMSRLSEVLFE